jgi:hypothetical protein
MVAKTAVPAPSEHDPESRTDGGRRGKQRSLDISPTAGIVRLVGMLIYLAVGYRFTPEMPNCRRPSVTWKDSI